MNKYVQTMKTAITNYHNAIKEASSKMAENTRIYKPEEADKANDAIMAKLREAKNAALSAIAEASADGNREVDAWGQLDGAKITDDAKLLDAGAVNPDQFKGLVQKYQNNATMLQLLANYAEKQNGESGGFSAVWNYGGKGNAARTARHFDTTGLPTAESKRAVINQHAAQAARIVDRISALEKGQIGAGPESPFVLTSIEMFGEDTE